jgi:hypothetical protein
MFDPCTRNEASRGRKLLIVDGHYNHFNMAFIDYANRHRILLVILPPHSTHRLQFLDIALFSPLANYYTQKLDRLIFEGQGLSRMIKRQFWKLFRRAWERAFTDENIRSGFKTASNSPPKTFAEVVLVTHPKQLTIRRRPLQQWLPASTCNQSAICHLKPLQRWPLVFLHPTIRFLKLLERRNRSHLNFQARIVPVPTLDQPPIHPLKHLHRWFLVLTR